MKTSLALLLAVLPVLPLQAQPTSSPLRIISAGAGVTELITTLGAADQLIAVDSTSRLPPGQTLPIVG